MDVGIGEELVKVLVSLDLIHVEADGIVGADVAGHAGDDAIDREADGIADRGNARTGNFLIGLDMGATHEAETDDADVYVHSRGGD